MTSPSWTMQYCDTRRSRLLPILATITTLNCSPARSQALPDNAAQEETLTEIIVTARKYAEYVQKVPFSVQVLSAEFLDEADITRLYELQFNVPGMVVNNLGLWGAGFALRGVADQGGSGLSVATHLNGVYQGSANLAIARMFDLERIEVLKGPQGTLYGRNATGGTINFITRSPQPHFGADIEAAYGSFRTARLQGHVNLPLDKAALRVAFIGSEGDGYIRNSVDDRTFAENDFWGLRIALAINPNDRLTLDLMAQRVTDDGASGELWLPQPENLVNPADIHLTTVTLANPYLYTENDNASLSIAYDIGSVEARSITGYARNLVRNLDDCSGSTMLQGCVRGSNPTRYDQFSQEFQLVSNEGRLVDWLLGVNYFDSDWFTHFHTVIPVRNPLPLVNSSSTEDERTAAVFGQATLHFAERWGLTAGLRFSDYEVRVSDIGTGVGDNPTLTLAGNKWHGISWRVDLQYEASDDALLYAGISTGFKSAGVTTTRLPDGDFNRFDAEDLTAYEVGVKTQSPDRRWTLNGAAFFYDFNNLQVSSVYFFADQVIFEIDNAAKAEIYGIEVAGAIRAFDSLTISTGGVWLAKREFVAYANDRTGDTLSGNKISRAPELTATTAIVYEHTMRNAASFSARLEYNYQTGFFYTKENDLDHSQASFGLLNLALRIESSSQKWSVFAAGRNLTDEAYFNQMFLQASPGYPVTYEVGVGYRF